MLNPSPVARALTFGLCAGLASCNPALNWREVRHAAAPVRVLMPCKPDVAERSIALREQATLARNALAALTGEPLGLQDLKPGTLARITALPTPRTMPMDLLANRPDVAAARARVQAGLSEVDVAKAQFYPNINLVAFAGLNSVGFGNISKAGSEQWGVGPAIRLPIFDGGRLRSQLKGK